jgi:Flp pilus assembly protein TadG
MTLIKRFLKDCRAMSAVEFALTAPLYAGVMLFIVDTHEVVSQMFDMKQAVKAGEAYILGGGTDTVEAKEVVLDAWPERGEASTVDVTKECSCGGVANSCSAICTGGTSIPEMSYKIGATLAISPPAYSLFQGTPLILSSGAVIRVR